MCVLALRLVNGERESASQPVSAKIWLSNAVAFEGQQNHLLASYNNQIGRPTGIYSGTIGGLGADAGLVPTAFVAVTEQL